MYQHISIVLLFIFITGAHSLKCYECTSMGSGSCEAKEKTCTNGETKCSSTTTKTVLGSIKTSVTTKSCASICENDSKEMGGVTTSTKCCDTDLCNGTGGLYKGSFILLLCPLFILTLFH
ncbi:ly6/PLAUR domain-containing protein 2-like isoform X1 [Paramisgurnus dabryanus]|uniref:ly6/PLAUR domain-containing protein 2-like isoform X1 n=1 Tax=Paramisgurnus dabryanus TaxID=90735 RepID=UPI0031F38896